MFDIEFTSACGWVVTLRYLKLSRSLLVVGNVFARDVDDASLTQLSGDVV